MPTYLLTWNPKKSPGDERDLRQYVRRLAAGQAPATHWRAGNNQQIKFGDRVFFLKQGPDSPGLMGAGWVTRGSYWKPHYNPVLARAGRQSLYIRIRWESLVTPEDILPKAELRRLLLLSEGLLKVACSGPLIPPEFAARLERAWREHARTNRREHASPAPEFTAWEGAVVEHTAYRRKRDQQLKRAALWASRGICAVCGTDYSKLLNGKGVRVLQVHHKRQLAESDTPRLHSLSDVAVVCANCHALIHLDPRKALGIGILNRMLRRRRAVNFMNPPLLSSA